MSSQWFNDDQVAHMESLGRIPREKRCASGWHVSDPTCPGYERCDCRPSVPESQEPEK